MIKIYAAFKKDWLLLWRDKVGLIFLFVLPVCLVFFITLAGYHEPKAEKATSKLDLLILNKDNGEIAKNLVTEIKKIKDFKVTDAQTNSLSDLEAKKQIADGRYRALIMIPKQISNNFLPFQALDNKKSKKPTQTPIQILFDPTAPVQMQNQINLTMKLLVKSVESHVLQTSIDKMVQEQAKQSKIMQEKMTKQIQTEMITMAEQMQKSMQAEMMKMMKSQMPKISNNQTNKTAQTQLSPAQMKYYQDKYHLSKEQLQKYIAQHQAKSQSQQTQAAKPSLSQAQMDYYKQKYHLTQEQLEKYMAKYQAKSATTSKPSVPTQTEPTGPSPAQMMKMMQTQMAGAQAKQAKLIKAKMAAQIDKAKLPQIDLKIPKINTVHVTTKASVVQLPNKKFHPSDVQRNVPAWTLFGMFFIITPLSGVLVKERTLGVLCRMQMAPVSFTALLTGKIISFVLLNLVQLALMLAVGVFLLPLFGLPALNVTDHPYLILLIGICAALGATGFGILVGSLVQTFEQANVIGPFIIVIAAAIGGILIPIYMLPQAMQQLAIYSPMHWAHVAFIDVFMRDANLDQILPNLIKLVIFFFVSIFLAGIRFKCRSCFA